MNPLILETPVRLRIPTELVGELEPKLTYEQKKVTYEWLKWHKIAKQDDKDLLRNDPRVRRHWFIRKFSREALNKKLKELEAQRYKSILFRDSKGAYTYSGLATKLSKQYNLPIQRAYDLPEYGLIPWANKPIYEPRWYQSKAVELLTPEDYSRSHGSVEMGTGSGKSFIMALILKRIALPAVTIAPTLSIAEQLLKDFTFFFGKSRVSQFFDGKKDASKLFTVAVSKSLMNVEDGDKHDALLRDKKILLCDESHLMPAESLAQLALDLFDQVPYRYFFSGTQMRSDGLDLLLDGIIGDIVLEMTVREGVDQGFLSKPIFYQWAINSDSKLEVDDPIKCNRVHLHYNPNVNRHAVQLAKAAVANGRRVLIMVDEVEQFIYLQQAGLLGLGKIGFAHGGGLDKKQKEEIPAEYHKSDPMSLVEKFDNGEFPILVGSSCISCGTDIKSVDCIIDLVGLSSEVRLRQTVGRGTRLFAGKKNCIYNDYVVKNIPKLEKHGAKRRAIMEDIYGPVTIKEAMV